MLTSFAPANLTFAQRPSSAGQTFAPAFYPGFQGFATKQ
jgi:hypothetical protein